MSGQLATDRPRCDPRADQKTILDRAGRTRFRVVPIIAPPQTAREQRQPVPERTVKLPNHTFSGPEKMVMFKFSEPEESGKK